ncbi:hypothetical protein I302_105262 [Kwoniella bestiolae CBS 10118]|uniref:Trafficking protein particle complex subunit 2-like protein n=1 Tax=Kwoniella bestiolae CBS 10118 TaxID=1296100 RepID=A0A1B9FSM5_9TREE|nr:hypothetical protein I302_08550 [Kwoniella bestiolae CBS 10118]OCF21771.1 hypothetical protein I302_08550 [Kwoniella bestiolae CBS 10118]
METRAPNPLHLTSLTILSPSNSPLYVHSFTGPEDELRHYHLSHAAVDVIEERIVMTSSPTKPAESYLGLLFCMEDMAFYGFQTTTKIRMVLSIALVDAMIKDADIVAIFRSIHNLLLNITSNPFLSLPSSFQAKLSPRYIENQEPIISTDGKTERSKRNVSIPDNKMFALNPEEIRGEWLKDSMRFKVGIERIGGMLNGRA